MGRKNRSAYLKPDESSCGMNMHLGDAWNQKQIQEQYIKELEARYKELNGKKRSVKTNVKPVCPVKAKTSRSTFGLRCTARPNSASSANKPHLMLNDRLNRTAYKEMDEAEKFFEVIRETVSDIVQKKLNEMIEGHFKGMVKRIEDISMKLVDTENSFSTLYNELHSKLTHYGEEHSRHFRYICMKMEYDKIFYQHMNGVLRQEHLTGGYFSCGQNLAQDLLKFPPPCHLQQTCPCVARASCRSRDIPTSKAAELHSSKAALPVNTNLCCGDVKMSQDKKETISSQGSQPDVGKTSPDLNLKEILSTVRHYYPISDDLADKLEKGLWHLDDDQSDVMSSAVHSEHYGSPELTHTKIKRLA